MDDGRLVHKPIPVVGDGRAISEFCVVRASHRARAVRRSIGVLEGAVWFERCEVGDFGPWAGGYFGVNETGGGRYLVGLDGLPMVIGTEPEILG